MKPFNGSGCFVEVRSVWSLFRFVRSRHSSCIMEEWIRLASAFVSRVPVAVRITVVVGEIETESL